MAGFWPNLHNYIFVTWKKNCLNFGDIDFIFKVTNGLRLLENGLSAPCMKNFAKLYCYGKELIRFWWPWLHFQGHRRAQIIGICFFFFLPSISRMNGCILTKLVQLYCCDRDKNWLYFGDLDKVTWAQIVGKWLVCTLSPEWMDRFWLNL